MPGVAFKDIQKRGVGFRIKHFARYYFWQESQSTLGFTQNGKIDGYRTLTELRKDLNVVISYCTREGHSFFITKSVPIIHYVKPKKKKVV